MREPNANRTFYSHSLWHIHLPNDNNECNVRCSFVKYILSFRLSNVELILHLYNFDHIVLYIKIYLTVVKSCILRVVLSMYIDIIQIAELGK